MQKTSIALLSMVILVLPSSVSLSAQTPDEVTGRPRWLIGGGVGVATSWSVGVLYAQTEFVRRWPVAGFAATIVAEYAPIRSFLWIESGVGIVGIGHGYQFLGGTTDASYTERVTFLSVPMIVKTTVPTAIGDFTFGVGPSFVVAIATGGSITDHTSGITSRLADDYFDNYLLPLNATVAAVAAYEYPTSFGRFGIELSVDLHLISDFDWGSSLTSNRLLTGRVQAIYRFGF